MPDSAEFDISELRNLSVDLGKGTAKMVAEARGIVNTGALHIKKDMIAEAKTGAGRHAKRFPSSITYDIDGLSAEIGPDKNLPQGALGNLLYFGTSTRPGVLPDIAGPLKKEAPIFEVMLGDLAVKSIL